MPESSDLSDVRRAILRQWMHDNDRAPAWVARRIGYTREYVANVLGGRYRFTDKLVRSCAKQLGIDFGYVGPEEKHEAETHGVENGRALK